MKFAKIAVFAITFSFLGSFCWGMEPYGEPTTVSTSQLPVSTAELPLKRSQGVINFEEDFKEALDNKSLKMASSVLDSYATYGLSKEDLKKIRIKGPFNSNFTLLDLACQEGDAFLSVVKKLVEDFNFDSLTINFVEGNEVLETQVRISRIPGIVNYLRSKSEFKKYFSEPSTVSTPQPSVVALHQRLMKFEEAFKEALTQNPKMALRVLDSYKKYGLSKDEIRIYKGSEIVPEHNFFVLACRAGDAFLPVVKKLVKDFNFDFLTIKFVENEKSSNEISISKVPNIVKYLRSNPKFEKYFK
jgi:hypothetical protein